MMTTNGKLAGYLVGYGIDRKDGTRYERWLKRPKHNTITKYMLNSLLQYNGDNTLSSNIADMCALFVKANTVNVRTGSINYGAYGDGSGATSTDDHELKSLKSEYSATRKSGAYYNGTYAESQNSVYKVRCSYSFAPANEDITIREVGTFHKIEPGGVTNMTARVSLDTPINIEQGDSFYFIYELHISFSSETIIAVPSINKYLRKNFYLVLGTNNWGAIQRGFPGINNNGTSFYDNANFNGNDVWYYYNPGVKLPCWSSSEKFYAGEAATGCRVVYPRLSSGGDMGGTFPSTDFRNSTSYSYSKNSTIQVQDYVTDSFRRDYKVILNEQWCNDTDVYAMYANGECYQFGNMVGDVFTPSPWHKPADTSLEIMFRQSWATDLLTPDP